MNEAEKNYAIASYSQANYTDNAIQIRLVTQKHLEEIEMLLRGLDKVIVKRDNHRVEEVVKVGEPYANEEGIQGVMKWVKLVINPHFVQGNFPLEKGGICSKYENFIANYRLDFSSDIILNASDWEVPDKKIEGLIDSIMFQVEGYASRLIGDKERGSYGLTMKTVDSTNIQQKGGGLKLFKTT